MNNLTKDIIAATLQEILEDSPHFLCFTDHRRLNILSWKSKKVPNAHIVKIGDKRFIGFIRKDRNGESYWKYQPLTKESEPEQSGETNPTPHNSVNSPNQPSEAIAKFPQRPDQTQAINHEPTDHNQSQ